MGVGGKHFENQHEGVLKERWALVVSTLKIKPRGFEREVGVGKRLENQPEWVLKEMGVGGKHFENEHEGVLEERWVLVVSTLKINLKRS